MQLTRGETSLTLFGIMVAGSATNKDSPNEAKLREIFADMLAEYDHLVARGVQHASITAHLSIQDRRIVSSKTSSEKLKKFA